jgi:hypothetical protein
MRGKIVGKIMRPSIEIDGAEYKGKITEVYYNEIKEMKSEKKEEKCEGVKTGSFITSMDIELEVGKSYLFDFEICKHKGGLCLKLSDYEEIG